MKAFASVSWPSASFAALLFAGGAGALVLAPPWSPPVLGLASAAGVLALALSSNGATARPTAWLALLFAMLIGVAMELLWPLELGSAVGVAGGAYLAIEAGRAGSVRRRLRLSLLAGWLVAAAAAIGWHEPTFAKLSAPPLVALLGIAVGVTIRLVAQGDAKASREEAARLREDGRQALTRGGQERARALLDRAARLDPEDLEILELRFDAWKFLPRSDQFHDAAAAIFRTGDPDRIRHYYPVYLAVTQVRPRLPEEQHLALAGFFAGEGDPDEGARIVSQHLQRNVEAAGLPAALLAVAASYEEIGKPSRAARYAETLVAIFPDAYEAAAGREILERTGPAPQ